MDALHVYLITLLFKFTGLLALGLFFIIGLGVCAIKHRAAQVILLSGVVILSLAVVLTEAAPLTRRWMPSLGLLGSGGASRSGAV